MTRFMIENQRTADSLGLETGVWYESREVDIGRCWAFAPSRLEVFKRFPDPTLEVCPNSATRLVEHDGGTIGAYCDFHADELEALGPARPNLP